jgi:hypothetical protein
MHISHKITQSQSANHISKAILKSAILSLDPCWVTKAIYMHVWIPDMLLFLCQSQTLTKSCDHRDEHLCRVFARF